MADSEKENGRRVQKTGEERRLREGINQRHEKRDGWIRASTVVTG